MNRSSALIRVLIIPVLLLSACNGPSGRPDPRHDSEADVDIVRIRKLAMCNPSRALEMLDSAESIGAISHFTAQEARAKIYFNPLQNDAKVIECAKDALSVDSDELKEHNRIVLLRLLCSSCYLTGQYEESLQAAIEGEKVAVAIDSLAAQGEFRFLTGECQMKLGQYASAYANMEYGIAALAKEEGFHAQSTLSHFLGEEINFMIEDGKYQEAVETGFKREELLEGMKPGVGTSEDYLDQQFAYHYSKMAFLLMKTGYKEMAEEYAEKFHGTRYSGDPVGKLRILEYLLESGSYAQAIQVIGDTDFPSPGDTISYDGEYYLTLKAEACRGLGESGKAYSYLKRATAISDSLERRTDKERALKVSAMYRTHEAELKAKEAETREARYILYIIVAVALCILTALGFLLYYMKTRNILDKNRLIEIGRSDTEKYIRLLQSAQARIRELDPKGSIQERSSEADSWQLFLKLEDAMDKDKIYLNVNSMKFN
ncbi:MAG: hypothetical protein IJ205_09285 [Bacteroidales bacterium]|nr:hypothetical protein [Bacteroidales bacterium]